MGCPVSPSSPAAPHCLTRLFAATSLPVTTGNGGQLSPAPRRCPHTRNVQPLHFLLHAVANQGSGSHEANYLDIFNLITHGSERDGVTAASPEERLGELRYCLLSAYTCLRSQCTFPPICYSKHFTNNPWSTDQCSLGRDT